MPELIDKQKVHTEIALIAKHLARSDAQKAIIGRILFMIDNMQAIKPEVRHGHWMFHEQKNGYLWKCSNCKGNFDQRFSYCPHCGARMDGGE